MSEKMQITFMQARLIRLATEKWNVPIELVVPIFRHMNVFEFIESGYGIFHCEGDEAILEDVEKLLKRKGININARTV